MKSKFLFYTLSSICIFIVIIFIPSCMSPVKKGFSHLEKNELPQAESQFKKAEDNNTFGAAAQQGLLEVELKKNPNPSLDELYEYKNRKEANQQAYKIAGYKAQNKMRKKGGFQVNDFREFNKTLQFKTFEKVEVADRVLALDSFLVAYPRPDFKLKKDVDTLIRKIFVGKIKASKDYVEWAEKIKTKKLRPGLQLGAIDFVRNTNDLLVLDTFIKYFPLKTIKDSTAQSQLAQLRYELVEDVSLYSYKYDYLTSLFHNHQEVVFTVGSFLGSPSFYTSLQTRLISTFLKEHEFKEFRKFTEDHPDHAVSMDCWADELVTIAEEEETVGLLRFLIKYQFSMNDIIVSEEIYKRYKRKEITEEEKIEWTQAELKMYESVLLENDLRVSILSKNFKPADVPKLEKYLKGAAPALRSFRIMHAAVDMFWQQRKWSAIQRINKSAQPLFPDVAAPCPIQFALYRHKQDWFKVVDELMLRPAENIVPRNFIPASHPRRFEQSPVMTLNETTFMHGELRDEKTQYTLFSKKGKGEDWMTAKSLMFGKPYSFTQDGKHILEERGKNDLRWLAQTEEGWKEYDKLPKHITSKFAYIGRSSLSADGKILMLEASKEKLNMYRWLNTDLYVSRKKPDGEWGAVIPLKGLNSIYEECAPFIHADGKTLYFSSADYAKTAGEIDIFVTRRLDDTWANWSKPINLGKEINDLQDNWGRQFHITTTGIAYFEASNFLGKDIMTTSLPAVAGPEPMDVATLFLKTNDGTSPRMKVDVKEAGTPKVLRNLTSVPDNRASFLMPDSLEVEVHIVSPATFPVVKKINQLSPTRAELLNVEIPIITVRSMLEDSIPVPLQNGQFDYDKAELKPVLQTELTLIAEWLKEKSWKIEIAGHTDNKGGDEYNKELSENRARSVRDFFLNKGIPIERLKHEGFGAEKPIASNDSDTGRMLNRRIEIRLKNKANKKKKSEK